MNDEPTNKNKVVDLFDRRWVRIFLFIIIPFIVFILVCAGIIVSQYGIDHTIIVLGQKKLVAGKPAAIRVMLINDSAGLFMPNSLSGYIVRGEKRHLLFEGVINKEGFAISQNFKTPQMQPGQAVFEINVGFDDKKRKIQANIEIIKEHRDINFISLEDVKNGEFSLQVSKNKNSIQVFTEDRGATTGLSSVIFIRTQNNFGMPVKTSLNLMLPNSSINKPPYLKEIKTDKLGLWAMAINPNELSYPIEVLGAHPKSNKILPLAPNKNAVSSSVLNAESSGKEIPITKKNDGGVHAQINKTYLFPNVIFGGLSPVINNPISHNLAHIKISARQISGNGPLYVDVFKDGQWVQANSTWFDSNGNAQIKIRPQVKGLIRLQITNTVLDFGKSIAVRHAYILNKNQSRNDAIYKLLDGLSDPWDSNWANAVKNSSIEMGAGFDKNLLSAFILSRYYKGHQLVPRLISSRKNDDVELNEFKSYFQNTIVILILLLGFLVVFIIAMVAFQAQKRQARITKMLLTDITDNDITNTDNVNHTENYLSITTRMILQGIVLFLIIIGTFASIALLLSTISWGQ